MTATPVVGDEIIVLDMSDKVVTMRVVSRIWQTKREAHEVAPLHLAVELHLTSFWGQAGLSAFEKFVTG